MYDVNGPKVGRAIPSPGVVKQSECQSAYEHLYKSQDDLYDAIATLHSRLSPVLDSSSLEDGCTPTQAAQSEVHGWLIAAEDRTAALVRRVLAITDSLTI